MIREDNQSLSQVTKKKSSKQCCRLSKQTTDDVIARNDLNIFRINKELNTFKDNKTNVESEKLMKSRIH